MQHAQVFYAIVGLGFNLMFILYQFSFVITGKLSAYLTTTDVKHSNVSGQAKTAQRKQETVDNLGQNERKKRNELNYDY